MYSTENAGFLTAACSPNRTIDTRITLSLPSEDVILDTNDIVNYKLNYASTAGKSFIPGSFVASQLELSLTTSSSKVGKIDFKTAIINSLFVEAGIRVSRTMVYVPMGKFYPDTDGIQIGDDGNVSIKATDIPPIMYDEFNSNTLTFPCSVLDAVGAMANAVGLGLTFRASFPNISVDLLETFSLVSTYREAFMYAAEIIGAYVKISRDGEKIYFERVFSSSVNLGCVLDDNYLFSVNKQESTVKPFQYIFLKANKDDYGVSIDTGKTTECTYDIIDNPFTYGHPGDFLFGLVDPVEFTEFYPTKLSFQGRPDIDTGDVLEYVYNGVTYILPVCNHIFEYNGGFITTVESIGSDTLKTSSIDSGVKTQITALRQNINTLVRDLEQTKSQITDINGELTDISTLLQTASGISAQVEKLEGDIQKLAGWDLTADGFRISLESTNQALKDTQDKLNANQAKLLTYFDFLDDGLTIGMNTSNIKLKLSNNKIQFLRDGTEVAYFSEGQLYVTDAHFLKSLVLGNFEFVPRSNGNLSLKRR